MSIPLLEDYFKPITDLDFQTLKIENPGINMMVENFKAIHEGRDLRYDCPHDKFLQIITNFDKAAHVKSSEILSEIFWSDFIVSESAQTASILNNNKGES